jgi:hypothetical protein
MMDAHGGGIGWFPTVSPIVPKSTLSRALESLHPNYGASRVAHAIAPGRDLPTRCRCRLTGFLVHALRSRLEPRRRLGRRLSSDGSAAFRAPPWSRRCPMRATRVKDAQSAGLPVVASAHEHELRRGFQPGRRCLIPRDHGRGDRQRVEPSRGHQTDHLRQEAPRVGARHMKCHASRVHLQQRQRRHRTEVDGHARAVPLGLPSSGARRPAPRDLRCRPR